MGSSNRLPEDMRYSAGIMAQAFWFVEFKSFLKLLYEGRTEEEIRTLIVQDNLFGAPNETRAKRLFQYLMSRSRTLDQRAIDLFFNSDLSTQKLFDLVSILRGDRLFFEFVDEIYREKVIMGAEYLNPTDAKVFFSVKESQSELVAGWNEKTRTKVRRCYINFMTEANLLTNDGKQKKITPPLLDIEFENYLDDCGDKAIKKAITGAR